MEIKENSDGKLEYYIDGMRIYNTDILFPAIAHYITIKIILEKLEKNKE